MEGDERRWYAFLIVSVATPFAIALPVVIWRLFKYFTKDTQKVSSTSTKARIGWDTYLTLKSSQIASDHTAIGRIMKFVGLLCAIGSLIIYFRDTAPQCMDVEMCHEWLHDPWWNVDLAFNCYFLVYFILRFLSSQNKLFFLFDIFAIVEYFTVPPTFVAIGLDRNWHGLRYLRVINLLWIVDLLHRFGILRTPGKIQFSRLVVYIAIAVICGAGTFLLLECSGDPWDMDNTLQQNGTFWNYAYYSVVTISTVGYGDMYCKTLLGKLFCCIYIFACLFFIASFISTAASLVPPPRKYPKFDHSQYFNHVVVCGNLTHTAAARFLEEFYQDGKPTGVDNTFVIFLHPADPDGEMILLLRDYEACVEYIRGSPLDDRYLEKSRTSLASACVILADQKVVDADAEDASRLLEIIAIKNYCPTLRVVVQVLKPSTMAFLKNYPGIEVNQGDVILCQQNVEMALVGMNCSVPGFSTLFCDLILAPKFLTFDRNKVPDLYARGCQMLLATVRFSPAFYGLPVPDAVRLCFEKFNVLLIGVYARGQSDMDFRNVTPNPTSSVIITEHLMGQIITPSQRRAKTLEVFCRECHVDSTNLDDIGPCLCPSKVNVSNEMDGIGNRSRKTDGYSLSLIPAQEDATLMQNGSALIRRLNSNNYEQVQKTQLNNFTARMGESDIQLDTTGMFYWQTPQDFGDCLLIGQEADSRRLDGHIVVFVLASSGDAATIGLHNLIQPLRVSSIPFDEMADVLLVGNEAVLRQQWSTINMLPKILVLVGEPAVPAVMRLAQVERCRAASILSAESGIRNSDERLQDKEVIIMTLRLRGLTFVVSDDSSSPSLSIRGMDIPLVSYLDNERSVRFLSQESNANDYRHTVPYMSGQVLASTTLGSLLTTAYFNPSLIRLCSSLVFGGISSELSRVAAEGAGLQGPIPKGPSRIASQLKTSIKLVDIDSDAFRSFTGQSYGNLFIFALAEMGIICVGLYRVFDHTVETSWRWSQDTRYVATNPPANTLLDRNDRVYMLLPAIIL